MTKLALKSRQSDFLLMHQFTATPSAPITPAAAKVTNGLAIAKHNNRKALPDPLRFRSQSWPISLSHLSVSAPYFVPHVLLVLQAIS